VYVNYELVLEYEDSTHTLGQTGVAVAHPGTIARFDDFMVVDGVYTDVSGREKLPVVWGQIRTSQ
jgi:hypothetical protein